MAQLLHQLVFVLVIFHFSMATDTLYPNQSLQDGQTLVSAKETFALGFFSPGSSKNRYVGIWYNKLQEHTVVWVANRGSPLASTNGTMELNNNGTLTINSMIFLPMPSVNLTTPVAQLLDNGNFVIREAINSSEYAWQSFDYPTDTLLPGMKLGWDLTTGLNRNLIAWRSNDDPSAGPYAVSMDPRGDPQLIAWSGSVKSWRSGPWNGIEFSNIPEMSNYKGFQFYFVNNKDEIYYMYDMTDPTIVTRLMVNQSGMVERFMWIESASSWYLFWYAPKSQCDQFSPCGPNGLCDLNGWPRCSCIQGFTPKSPQAWALSDASLGCVRRTELDCRNKSDGFLTISHTSLPETSMALVDMNISSLDECRATCLTNCSCTAYASADIRAGGTGCIIWVTDLIGLGRRYPNTGQDFFVRLAAADLASMSSKSSKKKIVVLITVCSVAILFLSLIGICAWRMKMRKASVAQNHEEEELSKEDELELPQIQWNTLMAATANFTAENILGEGGFGPVYKGKLADGHEIAVKRLSRNSSQGLNEFKNEVILMAKLQHRNLVRLLGYCIQGEERMLVYEYMPKGSLDLFLFDNEQRGHLDWQIRLQIIEGIARGLLYLHRDSRFRIIHRDLKASNILLDNEMNPKISDFGMARIFGENDTLTKTRKVVGTYGYMAPEYAMEGIFSVKSDVFSFGVLVLEILSGQRNSGSYCSESHPYLLENVWRLWNEGKALDLLDPLIGNLFLVTQVTRYINIGLLCVQGKPEDRPTMSSVVVMLSNNDTPLPNPKPPGFTPIVSARPDPTQNPPDKLR
ncbi:receptor-like serine/threonine-protein kinase SD1-8 [Dioscorea cayenensis subsp. rotundata]|uniref:Receptor-like serine/threonine-protein kinase n=1 Tax=Dioscorea cayennensis subsp. rotundata TaxID=55577 RepID=A0AB40CKI7_DIOCR|nr:receptor-like serine/threonine-protein kinase SD1-8 [Dioscorea cayenensis subsp. rotundata]